MKSVGIDELKRRLSEFIRQAEGRAKVAVIRHNRPVVQLALAEDLLVRRGRHFGKGKLRPARGAGSGGAYLKVLEEDRRGQAE